MASPFQKSLASQLDEIKLSFYKARITGRDKYLLVINYSIPRSLVKSEAKTYKALHHLFWCLLQDLRLGLPMSYRQGSYAVTCNTLLEHKHTKEVRQFKQSFNSQQKEYNIIQQFKPLHSREEMARSIFKSCKHEETLFASLNLPIRQDSSWQLIGVLSVVVNVQVFCSFQQLTRIGMDQRKMRHLVASKRGQKLLKDMVKS